MGSAVALTLWLLVGGLSSCDSTAKFSLPDRKFNDVQVICAFPAEISADGSMRRVCGAVLEADKLRWQAQGKQPPSPNGLQFSLNFVSTELKNPLCDSDRDQSIKQGELIELFPVQTGGANDATVGAKNFVLQIDCIEDYGPAGACKNTNLSIQQATPATVLYKQGASRCDPSREDTRMNVALLLDHSGSVSGFIHKTSYKEEPPGSEFYPPTLLPSDPNNARIPAVNFLIDALNDRDRLIGYYYNEKLGVSVAASDDLSCVGGGQKGKKCFKNDQCKLKACFPGDSTEGDTFELATLAQAETAAFGASNRFRVFLKTALEDKVKYGGEGRTPLWEAISKAYTFLKTKVAGNRHIVVVGDGPDSCTETEDFTFTSPEGKCREPCQNVIETFKTLRKQMSQDNYPVQLHFVQFQSKGYKQPDAHMIEMACRTGGTYQFINTEEINKADTQAISTAMNRALIRVRYALSGTWQVGLQLQAMTQGGAIPTGKLQAVKGNIRFQNDKFPSLATVYETQTSWKFGIETANEDRRVIFRKPCSGHVSCGGGADGVGDSECGANHCTEDALCKPGPAPDKLRCGQGGTKRCCNSKCQIGCKTACKN